LLQWLLGQATDLRRELFIAVELFLNGAGGPAVPAVARKKGRRKR
jgi:hypothetical protein